MPIYDTVYVEQFYAMGAYTVLNTDHPFLLLGWVRVDDVSADIHTVNKTEADTEAEVSSSTSTNFSQV
jgi:hypothetical protein